MDTWFASPERLSNEAWNEQSRTLIENQVVRVLLDSVDGYLVVLNQQRQVLAGNHEFLELLGWDTLEHQPGRRFGELLNCQNASLFSGGCGTSPACATCGALIATLEVLDNQQTSESECHLCSVDQGVHRIHEYAVKTTPLQIGGELFVVMVFQDISRQKRRDVLEKIFFHDIRNLLGGLTGFGELLAQGQNDATAQAMVRLSRLLNSEIEGQVLLQRAETGDFSVTIKPVKIASVLDDLKEVFSEHSCAKGKTWTTTCQDVDMIQTDRVVLTRVLINMIKNAFEATPPGQAVNLKVEPVHDGTLFCVSNPGTIPHEVALRLFERSFSTKGTGRGMGTYSMRLFGEGFLKGRVWWATADQATQFFLQVPFEIPPKS